MKIRALLVLIVAWGLVSACSGAPTQLPAPTSVPEQESPTELEPVEPMPTATHTAPPPPPTETPTLAPSPTPTRKVIAEDDFSDPNSGWEHYRQADGVLDYEQGGYRMMIQATDNLFWVNAGVDLADVRLEADVQKLAGPERDRFGLLCRLNTQYNYYVFLISSQGEYGIGIVENLNLRLLGEGNLGVSEAIRPGLEINHLAVTCLGNTLTLEVNGQPVISVEDDTISAGDVGLVVGSYDQPGVDVLFDNFVLMEP